MQRKPDRAAWLKGPAASCNVEPVKPKHAWRLVLLGAPGVGKGTQADLMSQRLGACHLSTGDVFRAAKQLTDCERTPAMTAALEYMRRGDLVPDATVLEMVWERSGCLKCGGGFLLDGFPRTVPQAQALHVILKDKGANLDAVLSFELPTEDVVARASGRRICSKCKAVYHVKSLRPKVEGVCDHCGGALIQREDDKPEIVRFRLETYEKSSAPLAEFYKKLGLLVPVAVGSYPEETYDRTMAALEKHG